MKEYKVEAVFSCGTFTFPSQLRLFTPGEGQLQYTLEDPVTEDGLDLSREELYGLVKALVTALAEHDGLTPTGVFKLAMGWVDQRPPSPLTSDDEP